MARILRFLGARGGARRLVKMRWQNEVDGRMAVLAGGREACGGLRRLTGGRGK